MSEAIIKTKALTKRYGATLAVDRLDLEIEKGEVFGLLGPNGAGKTTTILMLLGLTEPTSGRASVAGFDPLRQPLDVKRRTGYMPDQLGFYDNLSGIANLTYTARLAGLSAGEIGPRIAEALDRVHLTEVGDKRVGTYSRGMRQRLAVAGNPRQEGDYRHSRRTDRWPRSGVDARVPRPHPLAQARRHDGAPVLAPPRPGAVRM